MSHLQIPLAAHVLTGAILTLVLPLAVLIAVVVWYVAIWLRDAGER
jgi:hypothetical protein